MSNAIALEHVTVKDNAFSSIMSNIQAACSYGTPAYITATDVPLSLWAAGAYTSLDDVRKVSDTVRSVGKYADAFLSHIGDVLSVLADTKADKTLTYEGISITWTAEMLTSWNILSVKQDALPTLLGDFGRPATAEEIATIGYGSEAIVYVIAGAKFADSYFIDRSVPPTQRALALIRKQRIEAAFSARSLPLRQYRVGDEMLTCLVLSQNSTAFKAHTIAKLNEAMASYSPPTREEFQQARDTVLERQREAYAGEDAVAETIRSGDFAKMLTEHKSAKRIQHWGGTGDYNANDSKVVAAAAEAWATIPLADVGTKASRTWGIEVETVHAERVSRPAGWEAKYDGSLSTGDGECDCGCDACYDGEHCDYEDEGCTYNSGGESKEFVSPILRHFNSDGLRSLCAGIGDHESNTTPGIHVHVGADGLTVADVGRLLASYQFIGHLIAPLYHREDRSYCRDYPEDAVAWWLRQTRELLHRGNATPSPQEVAGYQPVNRYMDVNTQALNDHGTIEFRAMGPFYNYEHLVRWAWFCREMVNVSRLNLPQRAWKSCESLSDVITLLRTYGAESTPEFDAYVEQ